MLSSYNDDRVKLERTGFRDQQLSARHRDWGFDVPAVDIDWTVLEYDARVPKAIVEYKRGLSWLERANDRSNLAALSDLATGYRNCGDSECTACRPGGIPFVLVRYMPGPWRFKMEPRNARAVHLISTKIVNLILTEAKYVEFLYWLSGKKLPADVTARLDS